MMRHAQPSGARVPRPGLGHAGCAFWGPQSRAVSRSLHQRRRTCSTCAVQEQQASSEREPIPEPVALMETTSEINGPMLVAEVPDDPRVPEHIRGSRLLYLGEEARLCGIYRPLGDPHPMTTKIWDFFVILPLIVPEGPLGFLGWGGGTAARLILETFTDPPPMLVWEKDIELMHLCQLAMGADELAGSRQIQLAIGNPVGDDVSVPGGFSAIVVDWTEGGLLPDELLDVEMWRKIRSKLADPENGRVMARLGPPTTVELGVEKLRLDTIAAANAMCEAFDGQLQIQDLSIGGEGDVMALSGPPLDAEAWAAALGPELLPLVVDWEPWKPIEIDAASFQEAAAAAAADTVDGGTSSSGGGVEVVEGRVIEPEQRRRWR